MLKRLELAGFKSFADKTHFDFAAGLTAIVGPNGSGKSNVVDAVKWILGEQSAKSLRGGEMADVIFNGSTTRRSLGLAEVTMTFDNARRQLNTDLAEVQITRRVYRDGQGEYLINQQPSRLKDIKDLFLGSGAGSNAYCIIEQGRVDSLLQASTRDRRIIFEEAAGISRFKAKKTETLRRLERVDQNLARLKDIIDEVEARLRSVKLQASKAQRYQEHHQRLRELRVGLGLQEYHQLTGRLQAEQEVLDQLRVRLAEQETERLKWEGEARRLDEALARLDAVVHEQEARQSHARQQIATEEMRLAQQQQLAEGLEEELGKSRASLTALNGRLALLASDVAEVARDHAGIDSQCRDQRQRARALEDDLQAVVSRLEKLKLQVQADRDQHYEEMNRLAHHRNDATEFKAQVGQYRKAYERLRQKGAQAAEHIATLEVELLALKEADEALQSRLNAAKLSLSEHNQERDRLRLMAEAAGSLAAELKARRSGLTSRIDVLDGLERSHEGLGAGVREVFALLEQADPGPWRVVVGMVADFLTVRHEYAPLIDLALGETAQRFLVRDPEALHAALQLRGQAFASRVTFMPTRNAEPGTRSAPDQAAFEQLHGRFPDSWLLSTVVSCERPEIAELPSQLIGNVIVVPDLATARAMQALDRGAADSALRTPHSAFRYVTTKGELLEPDGTLTVGTHHAEMGILSRKSELRELREEAIAIDKQVAQVERDVVELRSRGTVIETQIGALQEEIDVLATQATDLRGRISEHKQRHAGLKEEITLSRDEMSNVEEEVQRHEEAWQRAQKQAEEAEKLVQSLHSRVEQAEQEIREKDQELQEKQQECQAAHVSLGKVEERLQALRSKHRQLEADLGQRRQEQLQGEQHRTAALGRLQESQRTMLQASSALAVWYLEKEAAERQIAGQAGDRDARRQERQALNERLQTAQGDWRTQHQQASERELQASDLRHRRDGLADRLREDYQLNLAELYEQLGGAEPAAIDPEPSSQEIEDLKRKIHRLGNVNLEALQELAELETRSQTLQTQYDDLNAAQKSLQEIIAKINHDSRKLFADTFATIKQHFQELFRKLFGGGMADIVLEDEADILESGIEIIARPPGKELRSISLMSGGEKTMTAVALLLAIFRSKPSPFCILDEVDAALDEANIGRFTAVLRDFLDLSQFILVTHSKKTMACADVLYGITMQESGISKRVSVRFEDWPDDGNVQANGTAAAGTQDRDFAGR